MLRKIFVVTICLALAAMNLAGVHVHFVDEDHLDHSPGIHTEHQVGAHAVALLDGHHAAEHDHEDGVDLDPAVKAFGKLSLTQAPVAALLLYILVAFFAVNLGVRIARAAPFRPPDRRLAFYVLPPSHAPSQHRVRAVIVFAPFRGSMPVGGIHAMVFSDCAARRSRLAGMAGARPVHCRAARLAGGAETGAGTAA